MPDQDFTGIGSRQRKSPIGGAANGIPLKTAALPSVEPRSWPVVIVTVGGPSAKIVNVARASTHKIVFISLSPLPELHASAFSDLRNSYWSCREKNGNKWL